MAVPGEQESFKSQTFSSPKRTTGASSAFASGQSGAAGSQAAKREVARAQYFDNRSDITADRLDRRIKQAEGIKSFKEQFTKPVNIVDPVTGKVTGTVTGLTQMTADAPRSLTDERIRLANKYGPTMGEIAGDFTYAAGKTLGAVADAAMTGKVGLLAGITAVSDYFFDKANKDYDNLNDVQKEIADNKDKYPLTSSGLPAITSMYNNERLALEAKRDANSFAADASGALGVDTNRLSEFVNEPIDTLSGGTMGPKVDLRSAKDYIDERESFNLPVFREPVVPAQEIKQSALDRFDPKYLEAQKELLDELNISPQVKELQPNNDDQASITEYNNPFNLEFKNQEGAEPGYGGETGQRFASFDTVDRGLKTGIERVAEIVGDGRTTKEFLDIYSPKSDNPKSYDNYLAFLQEKVGPTIEPNELKDLTKGVIRFENTADIAGQYLDYLQRENDRIYGGIVS